MDSGGAGDEWSDQTDLRARVRGGVSDPFPKP